MKSLNINNFKAGVILSCLTAFLLFLISALIGKQQFFLLLNGDGGRLADIFFSIFSYAGDGSMWIVVLLITLFLLKRKDATVLLISTFIVSTLLTQLFKLLIYPSEPRPFRSITDKLLIHTVPGVEVHMFSSFPSGHTATAFCFYLLFCLLTHKKWWIVVGFIMAALVGYARIYLAEHFPVDVAAGIIVSIVSTFTSLRFQQYWWTRKNLKKDLTS